MTTETRPRVAIVHCPDYSRDAVERAVGRLLGELGGMGAFVRPGARVLLKPNLIVPRRAEAAVTTHPEVVRAVAREVLAAGGRPFIADSPAFGSARGVARACGILAVAQELGIELRDLGRRARSRVIDPGGPFPRVSFGADALEADVIVNLPKIKTHCQMRMSLGLKNLFGAVAGKRKAILHFRNGESHERFARMLVAVARYLRPALTIEDGIVALERTGPTSGDPRPVGVLVASGDVVAADRAVLALFGLDPESVPYIRAAREMGFGPASLGEVELVCDPLESLRPRDYVQVARLDPIHFTAPRVMRSIAKQIVLLAKAAWAK